MVRKAWRWRHNYTTFTNLSRQDTKSRISDVFALKHRLRSLANTFVGNFSKLFERRNGELPARGGAHEGKRWKLVFICELQL